MLQREFKALDSRLTFSYEEELYRKLNDLSYNYVSEYVYINYYKHKKSMRQICLALERTTNSGYHWMKLWDFKSRTKKEVEALRRK